MEPNTHINHIEDEMLINGIDGLYFAIRMLQNIRDKILDKQPSMVHISVKWDGAPSIVCGKHPENGRFFVGTKSVFNKKLPKFNYTLEDIKKNHLPPGLQQKLEKALQYLPELECDKILQGDMMFIKEHLIFDGFGAYFKPNVMEYVVEREKIDGKELGVVFHTSYDNNWEPSCILPNLKSVNHLLLMDPSYNFKDIDDSPITGPGGLNDTLHTISNLVEKINPDHLKLSKYYLEHQLIRINARIKEGKEYPDYIKQSLSKVHFSEEIIMIYQEIVGAKNLLLASMDKLNFYEGFVITNLITNKRTKLVNRLIFSRKNMTEIKTWRKI